ncbi:MULTISPECIES: bifunctional DNA primase/polymerase [unclassified Frondihabitans]|uniref:bifunctional DNA primase/polymerase n=1 Tax=unclassified Frondihabitans TaxID=2626248 RepID=UPI000F50EE19|nr:MULTISPECIES: bifunctional DNA primase/polymerase [unclassified Frondihabitans]RPE78959.1 primase-like protein [Frondihabitans sp. PhB153]RPF09240.1 primase-like protein [Frondihabitans sp. PhB161]
MTRLLPEQMQDGGASLAPFLRRALPLLDGGYHVFPLAPGTKVPIKGSAGLKEATTDEAQVRAWADRYPNANVGVATGHGLIVVDIDVRDKHGNPVPGEANWSKRTHGLPIGPPVEVTTPTGGRHLIWRGPAVQTNASQVADHVDIRSEGGYIVGPGSVVRGKTYERTAGGTLPPFAKIPEASPALVEVVTTRQGEKRATVPGISTPQRNLTLAELLDDPPAEGGRNDWLARVAGHLARKHRDDRGAYDQAVTEVNDRLPQPLHALERGKTADSIWGGDKARHPDEKPAKPAKEQKESQSVRIIKMVQERFDIYTTPDGEPFAVDRDGAARPIMMNPNGGGRLRSHVIATMFDQGEPAGGAAVELALQTIYAKAQVEPTVHSLELRIAERPGTLVLDLAEPGTARCVVITAFGWTVQNRPPAGILFRITRTSKPLPAPTADGHLGQLREFLGWTAQDSRWRLVAGWLIAACFPTIPRPLLAFTGQPGSAKTTRARLVLSVLDPRAELGSSFGRNEGDEQAMAAGRYLVGWDNITKASDEVSDRLCRMVTGEEVVKRELYSDFDQATVSFRRTGALTAVAQPNLRADALERLIPIACDRIESRARRTEAQIREEFDAAHAAILGGLMDALVGVLGNLPTSRARDADRVRMADFQDVLHAYNPATADLFAESVQNVMVEAAVSDPFVSAVTDWLAGETLPLRLASTEAWQQARAHSDRASIEDRRSWWPQSQSAFTALLQKNTEPLHALGYQVRTVRTRAKRELEFYRPGSSFTVPLDGSES